MSPVRQTPEDMGYELVWQDDFNGTTLDPQKWEVRGVGPRALGFVSPEAVTVEDGCLKLHALRKDDRILLGAVGTQNRFMARYGYFECRAQLQRSPGVWAAFWIQSPRISEGEDPASYGAEIDIMECFRKLGPDIVSHNVHWAYGPNQKTTRGMQSHWKGVGEGFHTFALEWTPEKYAFFVDGYRFYEVTAGLSHIEEYLILSMEIPSRIEEIKATVFPDVFVVDYVKVYQKEAVPPAFAVAARETEPRHASVTAWPAPPGESLCEDYTLRVNGQPVPVHSCRVSAVPINQVWPGYQRPMDQTELAGFAHWDMSGPVSVEITSKRSFTNVSVRPGSREVRPTVSGRVITFTLAKPGQLTVELDGPHHALHLFADLPEADAPRSDGDGVRYFGPGVHRPGKLQLKSGETLYVAGGAVVHTAIEARGAEGVRILGRGVIDTSEFERDKGGGCIRLTDCSDVKIEGVILRDPDVWCLSAFGCRNLEIANVKLVGLWRYNADGIDICNSQDVVIRDSFVRAFDDAIVLKGLDWGRGGFHERPVRNVRVHDMVIWCDWGRALEIGAETSAPEIADVRFRDCDIIRTTHIAMDIQCGDRALVHDIRYENIRVEIDEVCPAPRMQGSRDERYVVNPQDEYVPDLLVIVIGKNPYSKDSERGNVRDITYADVSVTSKRAPRSHFNGLDAQHTVQGITIDNLRFNGQPASNAANASLSVGRYVSDVRFGKGAK